MLQLAIKTGWSLEYISDLPFEVLAEFKALNAWHPFTDDRQAHQLGTIASMLSHKVYKKGYQPHELFPYLQNGVPDFLEDDRVAKARKLLNSTLQMPNGIREKASENIRSKIQEEIDIENASEFPDRYVIGQLSTLLEANK